MPRIEKLAEYPRVKARPSEEERASDLLGQRIPAGNP